MTRTLGYRKDRADSRDLVGAFRLKGAMQAAALPLEADVSQPGIVEPRDQGVTSSCVGQAVSQALRLALYQDHVSAPELSALFPYYNGRMLELQTAAGRLEDGGMQPRDALKAIQKMGICSEAAWPFREDHVNLRPSWAACRAAHQLSGARNYYRLTTPLDVRTALAAGRPVIGGWQVDQAFVDGSDPDQVLSACEGPSVGGHCMVLESYKTDDEGEVTYGLLNSWGISWMQGGRATVDELFVASALDLWAIDT